MGHADYMLNQAIEMRRRNMRADGKIIAVSGSVMLGDEESVAWLSLTPER